MEITTHEEIQNVSPEQKDVATLEKCSVCHQALLPTYYFCPNCGNKVAEQPLSVSLWSQTQLYMFSAILPLICFLTIGRWKGFRYATSQDKEARTVGIIATSILIISTVLTVWFTVVATQQIIKTMTSNLTEFESY